MMRKILLLVMVMVLSQKTLAGGEVQKQGHQGQDKIETGIYVLVSFSMNDQSLRRYFVEAESLGARLVINGLVGDKHSGNRFGATQERIQRAKINVDINPVIFEQLGVQHVPMIVAVYDDGLIKKVSGHISLMHALEVMDAQDTIFALASDKGGAGIGNN